MLPLHPQDIGIILTYRCQSGCKHCLYSCGPGWEVEPISRDDLREALEAVGRWPHRPQVHFTGGEPFLHYSLLVEGVQIAVELDIPRYAETSGSWCTEEVDAVERFATLKDAGLQAILVSCSPFHAERIPPARTLRAVRAALEVFGPGGVTVYLPHHLELVQRFDVDRPTPLSTYEETFGLEETARMLWHGYGLISGGRSGYRLGHLVQRRPAEAFAGECCEADLLYAYHSHFDLYGSFISGFCGGLAVGSWRDLDRVVSDFGSGRYPPIVGMLVKDGPYGLFKHARSGHGYEARPEGYAGKCHLCVDLRRHMVQAGSYDELRPVGFYENL